MLIVYSHAHSDPCGTPGTWTQHGVTERLVAHDAAPAFRARCEAAGHQVEEIVGPLASNIEKAKNLIRKHAVRHVAVELHFNHPGWIRCHKCSRRIYMGLACPYCSALPSKHWALGPTVLASKRSEYAVELAGRVIASLRDLMPWAADRDPILLPDPRYGTKAFVRRLPAPAVIVEGGFGPDPGWSQLAEDPAGRAAYGLTVADAICDWIDANDHLPADQWGG